MVEDREKLKLDVSVNAVRVKKESPSFFGRLPLWESPIVVMEDGSIYMKDYVTNQGIFSDDIAEVYAAHNNGIFIPNMRVRSDAPQIMLAKFIEMSRILAPNTSYERIKELAEDPKTFKKLEEELKFLKWVMPVISGDSIIGLQGDIVSKENMASADYDRLPEYFGSEENKYSISLRLSICGFGYEHLSFSGKELVAEIDINTENKKKGILRNGIEFSSVSKYIANINKKCGEDVCFYLGDIKKPKIDKITLRMSTPMGYEWENNYSLKLPVRSTSEMFDEFCKLADKLSAFFDRLDKNARIAMAEKRKYIDALLNE